MEKPQYYSITVKKMNILTRHSDWLVKTQELYNQILEFYYNLWKERIKRIHRENMCVWFTNWSGDESILERFDKLPFKNKIIFVNKNYTEYKSSIYLPGFEKKSGVGQIWKTKNIVGKRYIDQFDFVEYLNNV